MLWIVFWVNYHWFVIREQDLMHVMNISGSLLLSLEVCHIYWVLIYQTQQKWDTDNILATENIRMSLSRRKMAVCQHCPHVNIQTTCIALEALHSTTHHHHTEHTQYHRSSNTDPVTNRSPDCPALESCQTDRNLVRRGVKRRTRCVNCTLECPITGTHYCMWVKGGRPTAGRVNWF